MIELLRSIHPEAEPERWAAVLWLVLARTAPLALAAPWLGWRGTTTAIRAIVAITISLAIVPAALATAPALPSEWLALALLGVREALLGLAFAIAASAPLYALSWTGALLDRWRGGTEPGGPLETLHAAAAVVLFVALGGHRLALGAFARAMETSPVGAAVDLADMSLGTARLVTSTLELALALAAPAALAFVAVELVMGLAGRVAPRATSWMAAMPLRAALGVAVALLGLAAALPVLGPTLSYFVERAAELLAG